MNLPRDRSPFGVLQREVMRRWVRMMQGNGTRRGLSTHFGLGVSDAAVAAEK